MHARPVAGRWQRSASTLSIRRNSPSCHAPQVTQYRVWVCRCTVCGNQVRGQHPAVAPDQVGATAHRLGPRVMAAAHVLHYGLGIPVRKVPAVLAALTGVRLTQGALTQDALRRTAGPVGTGLRAVAGRGAGRRRWCTPMTPAGGSAASRPA